MTLTEEIEGTGATVVYMDDTDLKISSVIITTSYTNFHACLGIMENYAADNNYSNTLDVSFASNSFKPTIFKQENEDGTPVR